MTKIRGNPGFLGIELCDLYQLRSLYRNQWRNSGVKRALSALQNAEL